MSWQCPQCNEELGDYNAWCEYCYEDSPESNRRYVFHPSPYFVRDIRIYHLCQQEKPMTPQEELFQKFFNGEVKIALGKTALERAAMREEACQIIFHAKVTISAVDHVNDEEKKAKRKIEGPRPFEHSLNTDETTTNAINVVKQRQKRLSKAELLKKGIEQLFGASGNPDAAKDAAQVMNAKNILGVVNKTQNHTKPTLNPFEKKRLAEEAIRNVLNAPNPSRLNPFAKKDKS